MQAWELTQVGFPMGPTEGWGIIVGDVHHRRTVTRGMASAGDAPATAVAAATAAISSCCGLVATAVSHDGSPVAAALAAARGALDERRLVITGAPDLTALAGARARTIGVTLRTKKHKDEHRPLEIKGAQGKWCSPQVGEAPLLFLEGSGAPLLHLPTQPWRSAAPLRCSRAPSLITRWWQVPTPQPPSRPVAIPPLGGGPPPVALLRR
jgi:hypothetical protein